MKLKILFFFTVFLAFVLRFYHLGSIPSSLDWDEASLGYNAYSILKTGRDEYGFKLPLSIRSFNDYKPPLYTYLTILPVALLGLSEYSVRITSALAGFVAVIFTYYLIINLFKKSKLALLTMFALSISPWHIQFSRVAFEANLALTLIIIAVCFFVSGIVRSKFLLLSSLFFGLSLYAYHSPRLLVPFFVISLIIIYFSGLKSKFIYVLAFFFILAAFYLPVIKEFRQSTAARFYSVSAINPDEKLGSSIQAVEYDLKRGDPLAKFFHNRRIVFAREILAGYLDHFNFDFLALIGDPPGRHHAADQGMLYLAELPLVVLGFLILLKNIKTFPYQTVLLWFIIAPLASSLTSGTPHAVRAIFYLPTYQFFTSLGIIWIFKKNKFLLIVFFLLLIANFFYYLNQYYIHTPVEYAREWQYGYKQAVEISNQYSDRVNKIIVTYHYDQPYIFWLFYNKTDPLWYQSNWLGELSANPATEVKRAERNFGKYEFRNIDWEKDKNIRQALFIGTLSDIPDDAQVKVAEIPFPDGTIAFRIVKR